MALSSSSSPQYYSSLSSFVAGRYCHRTPPAKRKELSLLQKRHHGFEKRLVRKEDGGNENAEQNIDCVVKVGVQNGADDCNEVRDSD